MGSITATMDWQGIALSVTYTPDWLRMEVHHLEILVVAPAGAILPVTETGYRSHFFHDDVEAYGGLAGYVRAWLDHAALSPEWSNRDSAARQFSLF